MGSEWMESSDRRWLCQSEREVWWRTVRKFVCLRFMLQHS